MYHVSKARDNPYVVALRFQVRAVSPASTLVVENLTVHPHPSRKHIMVTYRRHVMSSKRKYGTARCLVHYRGFVNEYLEAKRDVLNNGAT